MSLYAELFGIEEQTYDLEKELPEMIANHESYTQVKYLYSV